MRDFGTYVLHNESNEDKALFDLKNTLNLKPKPSTSTYFVTIKYIDDKEENNIKRLDYTINLEFCKEVECAQYLFRVNKTKFFINRKEPSLVFEQIGTKISESIYPLDVLVNYEGKVTDVVNLDEIGKRWDITKKAVEKEYKGDITRKIIQRIDSLLNNPERFKVSLSKDMFWNVFFNGNYLSYGDEFKVNKKMLFTVDPYKTPYVFEGANVLSPNITDYNTIEITYDGYTKLPKDHYLNKGKKQERVLQANLNINYDLDKDTHLPVWIKSVCSINNVKTIDIFISRLEKPKPRKDFLSREDIDDKPTKKKIGFFSFFDH